MSGLLLISKTLRVFRRKLLSVVEYVQGGLDKYKLLKRIPYLHNYEEQASIIREILQPPYKQYTSTVSSEVMALSLEASVFLAVLCCIIKPKRILDLGSGFSSVVFRMITSEENPKPVIWSIDDAPEWLDKTRTFLSILNLPTDNLITWQTFSEQNRDTFDFISYDLGYTPVRKALFTEVIPLISPGGLIVLDDVHKHDYRLHAKRVLRKTSLLYYSLKSFTCDKGGRYCALVHSEKGIN